MAPVLKTIAAVAIGIIAVRALRNVVVNIAYDLAHIIPRAVGQIIHLPALYRNDAAPRSVTGGFV